MEDIKPNEIQKMETPQVPTVSNYEANELNKVRDILFGNQMRDIDQKYVALDSRVKSEMQTLIEETRKSVSALENYIKDQFETLQQEISAVVKNEFDQFSTKLDEEKQIRYQSLEKFTLKMNDIDNVIDQKFQELTDKTRQEQLEMNNQVSILTGQLTDDVQKQLTDISNQLIEKNNEWLQSTIKRDMLASLFVEFAEKIKNI